MPTLPSSPYTLPWIRTSSAVPSARTQESDSVRR